MSSKRWYLLAYDVREARRLQRLHAFVSKQALKLQHSVYLLHADDRKLEEIVRGVKKRVNHAEDDIRLYPITHPDTIWASGAQSTALADLYGPRPLPETGGIKNLLRNLLGKKRK